MIDFIDNLQMSGQDMLHKTDRPFFQRFGEQGVVGISQRFLSNIPCNIPFDGLLIHQNAHKFGNRKCRVSVIHLNIDFIGESGKSIMGFQIAADDIPKGTGNQKIFLNEAQFPAGIHGITGIKNFGDSF